MNKMQKQFLEEEQRLISDFMAKADALEALLETHSSSDPDFEQKAEQLQQEMMEASERVKNHKPPTTWLTSLLLKLRVACGFVVAQRCVVHWRAAAGGLP
ncbi:hypothetical protein ACKI1H_20765 [Pseudomonas sp. YH-1]|uniref:hypothetical protein n=1 Tax=Pseudomonas sp. YH-1 TaxID=3384787 RepID=UPI003F7E1EC6